ncbi:spore gernimation protein GerA [Paenibacillus swuensis]|uniref:Spore gernimation protein GerA n=1 Tax=Paenibacillus swuensis TaxID=1178515 RepID=A0A172TPU0_9BACL|nr:spore gernimation protein GerA [Paenibacillus swuensis]
MIQDKHPALPAEKLHMDLQKNDHLLRIIFAGCSDVVFRPLEIGGREKALLIYIDGLVDDIMLDECVIKPLMACLPSHQTSKENILDFLKNQLIANGQVNSAAEFSKLEQTILKGHAAICIEGQKDALLVGVSGGKTRSVEQPSTENTVRGARDSFTEILRTNTSLIRRRIRSSRLKFDMTTVGDLAQTDVAIAYISGIVDEFTLQEIKMRIEKIKTEAILESGYIEQLIEERTFSPFPQFLVTERPDYVVSGLLQGQVAIVTDGSPFVICAPMTFWGFLQTGEDYYERVVYANFIRLIRLLFAMISLLLPSLYVALTTFHQQMIPTNLLLSIAAAREGVPFPALVEAIIMEITFEGLREAGERLPKQIGQAVSIVGGLVVGQAAVEAGIVSAPMVIVVSLTGIASFTIPRYNFGLAFRLLRFPLILFAGMFGLYGIAVGLLIILVHLSGLSSFGVPYLFPTAPYSFRVLKDTFFRAPLWTLFFTSQPNKRTLRKEGSK